MDFPNGASADRFEEMWCERCVNFKPTKVQDIIINSCPIWDLHTVYDALFFEVSSASYSKILLYFIANKCLMFTEREGELPDQKHLEF